MTVKSKKILKPPSDAPCWKCIQSIGSSVCRSTCPYWPKLLELAKTGMLEVAEDWKKVNAEISNVLKEGER